jgi:hypothetical protein
MKYQTGKRLTQFELQLDQLFRLISLQVLIWYIFIKNYK